MNKRVLIIGASGLVGYSLYEYFSKEYEVIGTYNTHNLTNLVHLDFLNQNELQEIFKKFNPEIILLPAALSAVDFCEQNREECWRQNVTAPYNLIKIIQNSEVKLVFYSTDYVFDGKNGPYSEKAKPNPLNNYGKAKLETERNIENNLFDYLILRTTVVYGWEHLGKNFVYTLINNIKNGKEIRVPKDQIGTPTFVKTIAEATLKLIALGKKGTYNIAGPELIDRYSFALMVADIFNLDKSLITPVFTSEMNQIARRPLKAGLKINKLMRQVKIKMLGPLEGLRSMKKNQNDYSKFD